VQDLKGKLVGISSRGGSIDLLTALRAGRIAGAGRP
jgi:hypothetical protein